MVAVGAVVLGVGLRGRATSPLVPVPTESSP
jgi:hypothetical protein